MLTKRAILEECEVPMGFAANFRIGGIECWSDNIADAGRGFKRLGYELHGVKARSLEDAPLSKRTIVKGQISTVRKALHLLGCEQPENLDIPDSLQPFTHREIWESTLGKVRRANDKVFIKPLNTQKGFAGHVYAGSKGWLFGGGYTDYGTDHLPAKYPVLVSEPVDFLSEWRVYVLQGEIQGVCNYEGNPDVRISRKKIREMITAFKGAPASYALDVGVMTKPKECYNGMLGFGPKHTALVEVNEGFSAGNYGISCVKYAKMVEARWKEMVRA